MSTALSILDSTFLRIESNDTPMHVGALTVFAIPDDAGADFVADVVARLREHRRLRKPFNQVLTRAILGALRPAFDDVDTLDMEYHVRHAALPAPGGERELGELISHLTSTRLDRSRPLWTCHVIEGLADNRFAVYYKLHHSIADGIKGVRLCTEQLATTPAGEWAAPWHAIADTTPKPRRERQPTSPLNPVRMAGSLVKGLASLTRTTENGAPVKLPFEAPASVLNAPVTNARRVATQQLDMKRMRAAATRTGASMNDVFLAVCGDALRDYLLDLGDLPEKPLLAGVPVSLRTDAQDGANAVGFVWATLGTDTPDPLERLEQIQLSMGASKAHLATVAPTARPTFTLMTMAPVVALMLSGQAARLPRPPMNVTISNVPGPKDVLYLAGARMEACYPISLVFQGMGLNITCISYAGQFNVGVVGSRDSLPSLQKIAVRLGEALESLETEANP